MGETREEHCYSDVLIDMRQPSWRTYGCLDRTCGAEDCGTCHPSGQRWVECRNCGEQRQVWELDESEHEVTEETFICEECKEDEYDNR